VVDRGEESRESLSTVILSGMSTSMNSKSSGQYGDKICTIFAGSKLQTGKLLVGKQGKKKVPIYGDTG
jgi:hypothetical protein